MPRIPVHTLDDAPEQTRPDLQTLQRKMGKLLNIHAEMAHAPVVLAAYTGIQNAIAAHSSFDAPTRESIALAVGAVDGCDYCQSAHTLGGKAAGLTGEQMLAIRAGRPSGDDKRDALLSVLRHRHRRSERGHLEAGTGGGLERRAAQRGVRAPGGEPVHQLLQPLRRHRARRTRGPRSARVTGHPPGGFAHAVNRRRRGATRHRGWTSRGIEMLSRDRVFCARRKPTAGSSQTRAPAREPRCCGSSRLAEEEPGAKVKVITSAMVGQLGIGPCPGRRHRAAARRRPYLPAR